MARTSPYCVHHKWKKLNGGAVTNGDGFAIEEGLDRFKWDSDDMSVIFRSDRFSIFPSGYSTRDISHISKAWYSQLWALEVKFPA
jgi:hypothetical protein